MGNKALRAQLKKMDNTEMYVVLCAIIDVVCESPWGATITESSLNSAFLETQYQVAEARKKLS